MKSTFDMRLSMPLVLCLLVAVLASGCWLTHDADGGSPRLADGDADADTDADADADADGDSPPVGIAVRPTQICGMDSLSRTTGGTLSLTMLDCGWISGCTGVIEDGRLDLRPVNEYQQDRDGDDAGACMPYSSYDCEVPAGDYDRLSVWGEDLDVPCFGGDEGDCAAPDCVQLPTERLPEGCVFEEIPADQVCGPVEVPQWQQSWYSVLSGCGCPADWRPAGCLVSETGIGRMLSARVARCSECEPEPVCQSRESSCVLYDAPAEGLSVVFPTYSESIVFDVTVGQWGPNVCDPQSD